VPGRGGVSAGVAGTGGHAAGPSHFGEAVQEAEAVQAERRVVEGLKRMGWSEADLKGRRKGEPRKVELSWELRSRTTMPLAWIAERLNMGTRGHLAWLLHHRGQCQPAAPADQCLRACLGNGRNLL